MIRLCEHILLTNFSLVSPEAQRLWLYAALQSHDNGLVNIHINVLPRLVGLTEDQAEKTLDELSKHNFYDNDEEPFLAKWEDHEISISRVLRWECKWCRRQEREFIPEVVRQEVLSVGFCAHCSDTGMLEVDHIKPVTLGGSSERRNLQALCISCNRKKGNRFIG